MEILFLLTLLLFSVIAIRWEDFRPTRYFFIRVLRLYKICSKYENVDSFSGVEVEQLLNFLILNKCDDRNEKFEEIRNGYEMKYYPAGVDVNRRKLPMHYVDIHDVNSEVVVRIGFDECDRLKYQIEYRQSKLSFKHMFIASNQGSLADFDKQYESSDIACLHSNIVKKYIFYTMRRVL